MTSPFMPPEEYMTIRVDEQIDWYDAKSITNQRAFKILQVVIIAAAATIPFLSGYIDSDSSSLTYVIGALGVIIAIISAVLGVYKFQENWIEYRTTCESLKHEKYRFLTRSSPYDTEDDFSLFVDRVEALISKENSNWSRNAKKGKFDPNNQ